jgi:hypothetical protein
MSLLQTHTKTTSVVDIQTQSKMLNDKWVLYHHLPSDKNWTLSGYTVIIKDMDTVEKTISINELLPDIIVKYSMLFLMRSGISPLWEDPKNACGGNFSYKVVNKHVHEVWKQMFYLLCGESLCIDPKYNPYINGITISPKKNFCILKIWLSTKKYQDPSIITPIPNLTKHGAVFTPFII